MRQAVMTQPGQIEFRDVPLPELPSGEVRLRIRRIGICGSDIHVWYGKHPFTSYPVVQGHEHSATVEAVASGGADVHPGMKVTARPQVVCGECDPCRRGDYNVWNQLRVQGFQAPGCAQDVFVVPRDRLVFLPDDLSYEMVAFEAAGSEAALDDAVQHVRKSGRIVAVGVFE